jgi:predicted outer membrane protein
MSASFSLRFGIGTAALSCLMLGYVDAQQATSGSRDSNISNPGSAAPDSNAARSGQTGRSSAVQSGQATSPTAGQSGRTYTANYGNATQTAGANSEIEHFMANCLLAENEAEVQLTQIAQQQAQSSDVKQFAQKMAQDHRQMIQQLQQVAGMQGSRPGSASSSSSSNTDTRGTTTSRDRQSSSASELPSSPGVSGANETASSALPGSSGASSAAGTSGRSSLSSSQTTDLAGGVSSAPSGGALQQLGQLERQILDRKMQLTKEDLQQKQGAEFDKCFVATIIPAHVHAVAELEVLEKQGGQLGQIAQQARPIVQQHLDHAKQLIKQLDNQSAGSSTAERSSSSRRER